MPMIPVDNTQSKDGLKRSSFSKFVLDVACSADASKGVVVGLEGSWGSGKTWVLNALRSHAEALPDAERPVVVEFNPWMLTGADDMVGALLLQLKAQLQSTQLSKPGFAQTAIEKISAYAQALTALKHVALTFNLILPGTGAVIEAVSSAASSAGDMTKSTASALALHSTKSPSLQDLRKEIGAALAAEKSRLILLIDDLDRISPSEVAAMVRAVKAVANFPNTVYLLAYDPEAIAHALETQLEVKDGRHYLEKIIQVPIPVPELPAARMQQWAAEKLRGAVDKSLLGQDEANDLDLALPIAAAMMQTPRDAQRLETRLRVACPRLANKINLADVLVAEALTLKIPEFARWVNQFNTALLRNVRRFDEAAYHRGLFGTRDRYESSEDREQARQREAVDAWGVLKERTASASLQHAVLNGLTFLFSVLEDWDSSRHRSQFRRLQEFRFMHRWRCFTDHHDPIDIDELQQLIEHPADLKGKLVDPENFLNICGLLEELWPHHLAPPKGDWCQPFAAAEAQEGTEFLVGEGYAGSPLDALEAGLRRMPEEDRIPAFRSACAALSLYASGFLLRKAFADAGRMDVKNKEPSHRRLLNDEQLLDVLAEQWCARFSSRMDDQVWQRDSWCGGYVLSQYAKIFGMSTERIRSIASRLFVEKPALVAEYLAQLRNKCLLGEFPPPVYWELLPDKPTFKAALRNAPDLATSHARLLELVESR